MSAGNILARAVLVVGIWCVLLAAVCKGHPLPGAQQCRVGKGTVARTIRSVRLRITPAIDKGAVNRPNCHLEVRDLHGTELLAEDDSAFKVLFDQKDINGDGMPDLVLESYSGGAHCCWTYYFLSLGPKPGLIAKFENERDAAFITDEKTGRIYIETLDGAFDYFDEVCHACSPFPLVWLRLDGDQWVDVSSERPEDYDDVIAQSQKALTPEQRQQLRGLKEKPPERGPLGDARYNVLMIVLAYLYSGREEKAHQALRELWPPLDQERIWQSILETRHNGILCYARKGAVCGTNRNLSEKFGGTPGPKR